MSLLQSIRKLSSIANMSFQEDGRSSYVPTPSPFDKIFAPHSFPHDLIKRATAFGLLTDDIEVATNLHASVVQCVDGEKSTAVFKEGVFDRAILEINLPTEEAQQKVDKKSLHIYKDKETGLYSIGQLMGDVLLIDQKYPERYLGKDADGLDCIEFGESKGPANQLNDSELFNEISEWSWHAAQTSQRLQTPWLNTMNTQKSLPGNSLPVRVARAFSIEFVNYLQRTFG